MSTPDINFDGVSFVDVARLRHRAATTIHLSVTLDELRDYRAGKLSADRLNHFISQCDTAPAGAARHNAIQEKLIQAVLDARARWQEAR